MNLKKMHEHHKYASFQFKRTSFQLVLNDLKDLLSEEFAIFVNRWFDATTNTQHILGGILIVLLIYLVMRMLAGKKQRNIAYCWNCGEKLIVSRRQTELGWKCPTYGCNAFNDGGNFSNTSIRNIFLHVSIYSYFLIQTMHMSLLVIGSEKCKYILKMSIEQAEFKLYFTEVGLLISTVLGCTICGRSIGFSVSYKE